jgi:hypothetical protein
MPDFAIMVCHGTADPARFDPSRGLIGGRVSQPIAP